MHLFHRAAHLLTHAAALLGLAATFAMILLGWPLHAVIAALVSSSFFVLAEHLRASLAHGWAHTRILPLDEPPVRSNPRYKKLWLNVQQKYGMLSQSL